MAFPESAELENLIRPVTDARGLDIEAVKTVKAGKKSQVVVAVAGDEAPTLDQLEEVSNELSELFDAAEDRGDVNFGAGYTLEVTTPGVDLPLTEPRHWRRNRGRLVTVGEKKYRVGALSEAEDIVALIVPAEKKSGEPAVELAPISSVSGAVVEIEFNAPPAKELELAETDFSGVEALADSAEE
ncbi:ribosome maturation factor RimP [Corynebacterium urinipleomorphum]|uniref:ribosome maturation factor RimP n=1 Tax=Corynebacterium urinipleomorphum TaxID=1852380 RepID=UPI000B362B2B|nr:ribosome maturation factor RimP [Corynebacterium urinipleomorphum]